MRRVVDLPAPLRPSSPKHSPGRSVSDRSFTATTLPNLRPIRVSSTTGASISDSFTWSTGVR